MGNRLLRGLMVVQLKSGEQVYFQLCSDEVKTLAVHLAPPAMAFSFAK